MSKKTVKDINVASKKVLIRVDFNVPFDADGTISDDTRIRACLPTLNYLLENKARIIICSHLGRPKGKVVEGLRLEPTARRLAELISKPVGALRDCIGPEIKAVTDKMQDGELVMLENLRFYPGEEANDPTFSRSLAELADLFVNDAFGVSHRAHASVVGVTRYLPAVAGFLLDREIKVLGGVLDKPEKPFAAVLGGAKVSEKLGVIEHILDKADHVMVGGGMAATFLKSRGFAVGASMVEDDRIEYLRQLSERAKAVKADILLPVDVIVTQKLEKGAETRTVSIKEVPADWLIADIGPSTVAQFIQALKNCHTVVWNGPMGVFEITEFATGTRQLASAIADLKARTVIGGGSTAEAVTKMGLANKMYFVSTGGGASLEFLEGKQLPGVTALQDAN